MDIRGAKYERRETNEACSADCSSSRDSGFQTWRYATLHSRARLFHVALTQHFYCSGLLIQTGGRRVLMNNLRTKIIHVKMFTTRQWISGAPNFAVQRLETGSPEISLEKVLRQYFNPLHAATEKCRFESNLYCCVYDINETPLASDLTPIIN